LRDQPQLLYPGGRWGVEAVRKLLPLNVPKQPESGVATPHGATAGNTAQKKTQID